MLEKDGIRKEVKPRSLHVKEDDINGTGVRSSIFSTVIEPGH